MAAMGDAQLALAGCGPVVGKLEEPDYSSSQWFFSREEIEQQSPSRLDGIDLKKETYFRKSYCTFLQDLGMCLKVPQVTIATAIVFCHRFFLRHSHLKSDRHLIATCCMFLAGKVEETPRPLRDVILVSYENRHKKDPVEVQKIKQKDVYDEQKEKVLKDERLVLTTLGFDLNIHHPYKPLVAAIKKFKVAQNALAQVAWNFVNDGLRTSLCLQFKPHHIAAGAIFLAAKFLKVKLPSDGDKVWWQEFEVTPRQLEEVSNQMLELYETVGPGLGLTGPRDPGTSNGLVKHMKGLDSIPSSNGHHWIHNSSNAVGFDKGEKHSSVVKTEDTGLSGRRDDAYEVSASHGSLTANVKQESGQQETEYEPGHENSSAYTAVEVAMEGLHSKPVANQVVKQAKVESKQHASTACTLEDGQIKDELRGKKLLAEVRIKSEPGTALRKARVKTEIEDRKSTIVEGTVVREVTEAKSSIEEREMEDVADSKPGPAKVKVENEDEEPKKPWVTTIEDVNTDRVKALAQKWRKSREGLDLKPAAVKVEPTDEEELLERELESGVEAAAEAERVIKQERRDMKMTNGGPDGIDGKRERMEDGDAGSKRRRHNEDDGSNEKKRTKSTERAERHDWMEVEADRGRAGGGLTDRGEDGELSNSSHMHEQSRSPRQQERRAAPSGSHEKTASPQSKRHRDAHVRRDSHRDSRVAHSSRERDYHQRDYHQHRPDGERDRHHHKR